MVQWNITSERRPGRAAPGLVHSLTSRTDGSVIAIDNAAMRLKRMKCGTITGARLLQEQAQDQGRRYKVAMITLTYALTDAWQPYHIANFCSILRKHLNRRGIPWQAVWVLELQKRGAPHYHLLVWLPKGVTLPKPDKRGWWRFGSTRIEWARNAVGYIAKYSSKGPGSGTIPKGARIYAVSGLRSSYARQKRWWLSPKWVRDCTTPGNDPIRVPGGGFVLRDTGEFLPSPWLVVRLNGQITLIKVGVL